MWNFTADEITALWLSLKVASRCTLFSLLPATLAGWLLAR
jgi:ABC-type molybdate transport system permease subunit